MFGQMRDFLGGLDGRKKCARCGKKIVPGQAVRHSHLTLHGKCLYR